MSKTKIRKDNTHDEEGEEPLFGSDPESHGVYDGNDEVFNRIVNDNWSPDEQSELSEAARNQDPDFESPQELNDREPAGGVSKRGKVSPEESDLGEFGKDVEMAADLAGGRLGKTIRFMGKHKKKAAAGGLTGTAITAVILLFGIAQGPLQVIHMGKVLARSFSNQDDASNDRMGKLLRWARSGDPGETRLGVLQSQIAKRAEIKLKERGVQFIRDPTTGQMTGVRMDQEKNPTYKGLSEAEFKRQFAADNGISPDKVFKVGETGGPDGRGPIWRANASGGVFSDNSRSIIKAGFDSADFGKISRAVAFRPVAEKLGKPSILHPWKRIKYNFEQRASDRIKAARERQMKVTERSADAKTLAEKLKDKVGESEGVRKAANIGLGIDLGICLAKDIAGSFPDMTRGNVVDPSSSLAADGLAQSSQTESGDDFDSHQPGDEVLNYPDENGVTPWSAMALQALEGKENPGGTDMPDKYKAAFSSSATAADIEKGLDSIGAGYLCSPLGNALTTIAGVALIATGPGKFAQKAVSGIGSAVVTSAVLYSLTSLISQLATDAPPVTSLRGALGGNFAAFGSRELANMDYRSAGAVEMSAAEETALAMNHRQIEQQELASKSFAERMFDPYDNRSLLANIIDRQTLSISQNLTNLAASIARPSELFGTFSSILFPKAAAASSKNYDWGDFRLYGFTLAELKNSKYQDTRANADKAAKLFDGSDSEDYIDRAGDCFGVKISKGSDGWDAKKDKNVNPTSTPYQKADCKDDSENWKRIRFFIFDTSLAKGAVCYNGDDEDLCNEMGFNDSGEPTGPIDTPSNGNLAANKDKFTAILKLPPNAIGPPEIGFYNQCEDGRWSTKPYPYASGGSNSICESACGPTSLAMVISTIGNKIIQPDEMAQLAAPYHVSGGTAMSGAIHLVEQYGLTGKKITTAQQVKETLRNGGFVIMNANPSSPFTQAGHFIVIRAISADGTKFYVADPADNNSNGENRSYKAWPVSSISSWLGPDGLYAVEQK